MSWNTLGGYKTVEKHLHKKKITSVKFIETGNLNHLFTNKATDYFIKVSSSFTAHILDIFLKEVDEDFDSLKDEYLILKEKCLQKKMK